MSEFVKSKQISKGCNYDEFSSCLFVVESGISGYLYRVHGNRRPKSRQFPMMHDHTHDTLPVSCYASGF